MSEPTYKGKPVSELTAEEHAEMKQWFRDAAALDKRLAETAKAYWATRTPNPDPLTEYAESYAAQKYINYKRLPLTIALFKGRRDGLIDENGELLEPMAQAE